MVELLAPVMPIREETRLMDFILDPGLRGYPDLARMIQESRPILEDALGETAKVATARWSVAGESGRHRAILNLSDFTYPQGVNAELEPRDFEDPRYLRRRFYDLLGGL